MQYGIGGTSYAAPRWAGCIALANQEAVANGAGHVGFLNTPVYNIGTSSSYNTAFHDITSGNNGPSGANGFPAVTGYDLVTGWGSPNGAALINALAPPPGKVWQGSNDASCGVDDTTIVVTQTAPQSLV